MEQKQVDRLWLIRTCGSGSSIIVYIRTKELEHCVMQTTGPTQPLYFVK